MIIWGNAAIYKGINFSTKCQERVDIIRLWGDGPIDYIISLSLKKKLVIYEIEFNIFTHCYTY